MNIKSIVAAMFLLFSSNLLAAGKEIAITIDDLPFVGSANNDPKKLQREHDRFMAILQALVDHKVPATGFIIAGSIEKGQWELLEEFRNQGFQLGNHTYSHRSLNSVTTEKYIEDVNKADEILSRIMTSPKYFRYPYLAESKGEKREKVYQFLAEKNYTIAPVTIDSKDFIFNNQLFAIPYRLRPQSLPALKKRYLSYIWAQTLKAEARSNKLHPGSSKQILLIHANLINSHFLGDIIDMYQKNGYRIVSLDEIINQENMPVAGEVSGVVRSLFKEQ
ncbi:polysaccharide deacetylase [Legionella quinlivanii]|uniref:Polysaccharide deacetylase n=1 Tax=Legionella quinlivanii TaxID=45073 RepID=A0A0W0Y022_9GAMM|nr:polysaccharide deacetylase family protein [Legionella quinlivanii]KTD50047.1 polysaccharide deacetylase [Legionella quinlivanii]MCW8450655.1 polysaccharide deacetylase family protein [Legionella quinlivanii]SEF93530.1 Peptidoglycan/xylan/chitin deacetylase, PgdA/CDA1 family [Legionella quinlivanii DSM 21216]STY11177.1 polysaccharide deacetylase [Legionella quinlivanii]